MVSTLLMLRRLRGALRVALREEDFAAVLSGALVLIAVGTLAYTLGNGWNVVDGLYFAVATLTTSSIADPSLVIEDAWLKIFTVFYVLTGIGILVEVARRLGMGFIAYRRQEEAARAKAEPPPGTPPGRG